MIEKFCTYLYSVKNRSHRTITEYRYDLKNFENFIKKALTKVSSWVFIRYLDRLTEENKSSCHKARKLSAIKSFYRYLQLFDTIKTNPAINVGTPKIEKRLPKYLTLVESVNLVQATQKNKDYFFRTRDCCIIQVFLNCGLRLSELINLQISKISGDKIEIICKGNKQRFIYLNNACQKALHEWLSLRKDYNCPYVFISKKDTRLSKNSVQACVKKYLANAGLNTSEYHVHSLRHTSATLMYQYGKTDIRVLQRF